jgi:hypothetical protein
MAALKLRRPSTDPKPVIERLGLWCKQLGGKLVVFDERDEFKKLITSASRHHKASHLTLSNCRAILKSTRRYSHGKEEALQVRQGFPRSSQGSVPQVAQDPPQALSSSTASALDSRAGLWLRGAKSPALLGSKHACYQGLGTNRRIRPHES